MDLLHKRFILHTTNQTTFNVPY